MLKLNGSEKDKTNKRQMSGFNGNFYYVHFRWGYERASIARSKTNIMKIKKRVLLNAFLTRFSTSKKLTFDKIITNWMEILFKLYIFYNRNHQNSTILTTMTQKRERKKKLSQLQNEQARIFYRHVARHYKFCYKFHFFRIYALTRGCSFFFFFVQ